MRNATLFTLGLFVLAGAVGGLENNTEADLLAYLPQITFGLLSLGLGTLGGLKQLNTVTAGWFSRE
jgi:hypothetical protein